METISYMGQPDCLRLANGEVDLVVTTAIGPRIIRYGMIGGENILAEIPDGGMTTPLGEWKPWGGHRLWAAPEAMPRSYVPDNSPVESVVEEERSVRLVATIEQGTMIGKEITVSLDAEGSGVTVRHRITNHGIWGIELAPWALTIMRGGGTTILPQEPRAAHGSSLLPVRTLALWAYTDLADPRWRIGPRYIRLSTDSSLHDPQKIGLANRQGWAAYHRDGLLFVKRFPWRDDACYPDMGCNTETYTAGDFMEVESLGPLTRLEPGESVEHLERWYLFDGVMIGEDEESVERALAPLLARTGEGAPR